MGRNKSIYALADVAVVVSSAEGRAAPGPGRSRRSRPDGSRSSCAGARMRRRATRADRPGWLVALTDDGRAPRGLAELLDIAAAAAPARGAAETLERYEQARLFVD